MSRNAVVGMLLLGLSLWPWRAESPPPAARSDGDRSIIARGVVISDWGEDGSERHLRADTLRELDGQIGFFRSPVLNGFQLRDVEMVEGGVSAFKADGIRVIPALRTTLIDRPSGSRPESHEQAKKLAESFSALLPNP